MTSLKVKYANQIMEDMLKNVSISDELIKKAGGALEAYKSELALVINKEQLDGARAKYEHSIAQEEGILDEMLKAQCAKAKELGLPGYCGPGMEANDHKCHEEKCEKCGHYTHECKCGCQECMADDPKLSMAAELTISQLVKVADTLDKHGFSKLASVVDEALEKMAKYKTHKGKKEKEPKGAEHKAPKEWWDQMVEDIKKKNPDYSKKRVNEIIGDIWDNELTDKKRKSIYKKYEK